jgi:hypothetical protein
MECFDVHAIHVAHFYTKLNAQNHLYVKNIALITLIFRKTQDKTVCKNFMSKGIGKGLIRSLLAF